MKGIDVMKRVCLCVLAGFGSFCLVILLLNQWNANPMKHQMLSILGAECSSANTNDTIEDVDTLRRIEQMTEAARKKIRADMNTGRFDDGGRPIRSIVLSTWRSGSTFFADILGAHPANLNYYEPLEHFDYVQIRGPPLASKALHHLKSLLNCEFAGLDDYIEMAKTRPWLLNNTTHLWEECESDNSTCYDHRYLSKMCKLYPFQSMKLLRLRLRVSQELLADEKLGVRMVLLVRDPRGTMQSRKTRWWCQGSPDCSDSALHCADLVSDYKIAVELIKKYPTTFRVIRYEDLSTDPFKQAEELHKFYGRDFHPNVREFLVTHTSARSDDAYGTFRDSKSTPFHWKTDLTFEEVEEIQRNCATAMEHWGYVPAINATHLREFNPVTDLNMMNL